MRLTFVRLSFSDINNTNKIVTRTSEAYSTRVSLGIWIYVITIRDFQHSLK